MKKFLRSRVFVISLGVLALLALVYLAAGISSLKFRAPQTYIFDRPTQPVQQGGVLPALPMVWQTVLIWSALLVFALGIVFVLLDPAQRKKLLWALFKLVLLTVVILLVVTQLNNQKPATTTPEPNEKPASGANVFSGQGTPPLPFIPPHLPSWAVYLISLATILAAGGAVWLVVWLYRRNQVPVQLDELADIARSSLKDIRVGKDWEDAIIQCYVRMSAVVGTRRSLSRQSAMTPSEFALQMEKAGLPGEAVHQLTGLFERVRYGAKKSTRGDIDAAVECLTTILHACGEAL